MTGEAMNSRERVLAALRHEQPDRVPRFEIWIDAFLDELGGGDAVRAYVDQGQDGIMLPSINPPDSNAWRDGVDEFGRVWQNGFYVSGRVDSDADLDRYTPPLSHLDRLFDAEHTAAVRAQYPDHCLIYGTHIGPLTAAYMAMGFERFFVRIMTDAAFAHRLLENRTQWCIAQYQRARELGAEVLVLGDDVAFRDGPMISPRMYREFVLPYHCRIVAALDVPVIWHSDGDIRSLLPMAIEAGFVGVHGLEPAAGVDLAEVKREYGRDLALVGNLDISVLAGDDADAVRRELDRCMAQGAPGGGYMLASCNSIFAGLNGRMVREMFRYAGELLGH
jgi:uroporphyrinogen decarboxylase